MTRASGNGGILGKFKDGIGAMTCSTVINIEIIMEQGMELHPGDTQVLMVIKEEALLLIVQIVCCQ